MKELELKDVVNVAGGTDDCSGTGEYPTMTDSNGGVTICDIGEGGDEDDSEPPIDP